MDDGEDPGDVFAIPDLYGPSKLISQFDESFGFLFENLRLNGKLKFRTFPLRGG
jgi:hypothetical protein